MTVLEAATLFLEHLKKTRSVQTVRTYGYVLRRFCQFVSPSLPLEALSLDAVTSYLNTLSSLSPYTERVHGQAVKSFFVFLAAQGWKEVNFARLSLIMKGRRRLPQRLITFPEREVERLLGEVLLVIEGSFEVRDLSRLRELRDAALIVTLAHTGLRVSEVVRLRVGDILWDEGKAIIVGKGGKQAIVWFSRQALRALRTYLEARSRLISPISSSQPLFSGHGGRAGKKLKSLSPRQVERVLSAWVTKDMGGITPHTLRHYFVTRVVRKAGVSIAKKLARHASISTTDRYTHLGDVEVERAYRRAFSEP